MNIFTLRYRRIIFVKTDNSLAGPRRSRNSTTIQPFCTAMPLSSAISLFWSSSVLLAGA
jgi:hypothetical protein